MQYTKLCSLFHCGKVINYHTASLFEGMWSCVGSLQSGLPPVPSAVLVGTSEFLLAVQHVGSSLMPSMPATRLYSENNQYKP